MRADIVIQLFRILNPIISSLYRPMLQNLSRGMTALSVYQPGVAAVVQMRVTNKLSENLSRARELVSQASKEGAQLVFLPEACDFIGENRRETLELSQPLYGSTVEQFRKLSRLFLSWTS